MTADDWQQALTGGLDRARVGSETLLRRTLDTEELPFWWRSTFSRAEWAARRCLESLAATAQQNGSTWLCLERTFRANLKTAEGSLKVQARCDAVLLDQSEFAGANGLLIDFRTGGAPPSGTPTATQVEAGHGLGLGALFLMGLAEGLHPETTRAGVIHPDGASVEQWTLEHAATLEPAIEGLAKQQRSLVFGQKSPAAGGHSREDTETLPIATTPVGAAVLAAKAALTREHGSDKTV